MKLLPAESGSSISIGEAIASGLGVYFGVLHGEGG